MPDSLTAETLHPHSTVEVVGTAPNQGVRALSRESTVILEGMRVPEEARTALREEMTAAVNVDP